MFFRRLTPHVFSFEERIGNLKKLGISSSADPSGGTRVSRNGFAAVLKDMGAGKVGIVKAGVLIGGEVAHLVNGGYQMFLETPAGKHLPALSTQLTGLHDFDEDLREGLGLTSLYNVSLGTTSENHMYDRVTDRDRPHGPRPWEKKAPAQS
jgi:hypothetical protein